MWYRSVCKYSSLKALKRSARDGANATLTVIGPFPPCSCRALGRVPFSSVTCSRPIGCRVRPWSGPCRWRVRRPIPSPFLASVFPTSTSEFSRPIFRRSVFSHLARRVCLFVVYFLLSPFAKREQTSVPACCFCPVPTVPVSLANFAWALIGFVAACSFVCH